jgi:hypothetical protein
MRGDESLRLTNRLESPHPSLPDPGRLMRLFGPVIGILVDDMDRFWYHITMRDRVTT